MLKLAPIVTIRRPKSAPKAALQRRCTLAMRRVWPLIFMVSCQSSSIEKQAQSLGLDSALLSTPAFTHRIFRSKSPVGGSRNAPARVILIDGDGRAFLDRHKVASNPTPKRSKLLTLVGQIAHKAPVSYVGRPCYLFDSVETACQPVHWTLDRYGDEVARSLATAVKSELNTGQRALLVGYSGGGVLSLLVAAQIPEQTLGVVTLASPLDLQYWAKWHGYTPLRGSTDPADDSELYSQICRLHLFGANDIEVPPALVDAWRWPPGQQRVMPKTGHNCCWEGSLLKAIEQQLTHCLNAHK